MRKRWVTEGLLALLFLWANPLPVFAGDSVYGKVIGVIGPEVVLFSYGPGRYEVRLVGIDAPKQLSLRIEAQQFMTRMIVGQNARIRFEYRANNQMVSRLFTDHPVKGIKDVGLELVREGLALPQLGYDYRYGELSAALAEAQQKQRGVWRIPPPR